MMIDELKMLDITAPKGPVQIDIRRDGKVLWINVEGFCVLRICQIENLKISDKRLKFKRRKLITL